MSVSQDAPRVAPADKGVSVMGVIVENNRADLKDPIGTRIVRRGCRYPLLTQLCEQVPV